MREFSSEREAKAFVSSQGRSGGTNYQGDNKTFGGDLFD